jgi:Flp pilus assembly protein TadG
MRQDEDGSAVLTTLVMLPLLLVVVVGVLELAVLRAVAQRADAAADLATIVAAGDQDQTELARSGTLQLAADAAEVAREYFALNLSAAAPALAVSAMEIAAAADIATFAGGPSLDPRTGARYERPTVRLIASVPVRTPGLAMLLMPAVTTLTIRSVSSPR